jgi:type I restriction enzyme S subunit
MESLFRTYENGNDSKYINLVESNHPVAMETKSFIDSLWVTYEKLADRNFTKEMKIDFDSRYWEMYLTCLLAKNGIPVKCPKPGPDILIECDHNIWVEAIAPTPGETGYPDSVPQAIEVQDYPSEQIILRYRTAIREKFEKKYFQYIESGIIVENDPYVIAISSCKIDIASLYPPIPEIIKSVFPIGHQQIHINQSDGSVVGNDYKYTDVVEKKSGNTVSTDLFFDEKYNNISGILYSSANAVNNQSLSGNEIIFIHNPNATNPIPEGFFQFGTEYIAIPNGEYCELKQVKHT